MNAALEVQLETGHTLLITDADDTLAWRRAELIGWSVGLYEPDGADDNGAVRFVSVDDTSIDALTAAIGEVLMFTPQERSGSPVAE